MTRNVVVRWSLIGLIGTGTIGSVTGCESKAGSGALIGGAGGAAAGGLIGSLSHARAGEGALIGGALGALGGALIGHQMDKDDERSRLRSEYNYHASRDYDRRYGVAERRDNCSLQDVVNWTARGTREDVIIDRIERSGAVFHLTAADENRLRDEGVSEVVIQTMKDTARRGG